MRKVLMLAVALMVAAAPAFAQDKKAADKPAAPGKLLSAAGTVTAVTADSLTVKGKTAEWTFAVDSKTKVTAAGASHKTAAAKADDKPTPITAFVSVGNDVTVGYHDMGATKHAASVRVTAAKPAPKK